MVHGFADLLALVSDFGSAVGTTHGARTLSFLIFLKLRRDAVRQGSYGCYRLDSAKI